MAYKVKEIYYTLQGEGAQSGRAAVFCRFSGCNLWSGREEDRTKAICQFCDTDFWGIDGKNGGKYSAEELAQTIVALWKNKTVRPYVVCTGGEPLLQLDAELVTAFSMQNIEIGIETNGTLPLPAPISWVCVSPKAGTDIVIQKGNELKLIFPQAGAEPEKYALWDFENFYLQPMDSPLRELNTRLTLDYCLANPQWKLSLQTHKILNIP